MNSQPANSHPLAVDLPAADIQDPLLDCLHILTRLHGRPVSPQALKAGLPLVDHKLTPVLFVKSAETQGYSARFLKRPLNAIPKLVLPVVLMLRNGQACVLTGLKGRKQATVIIPESGFGERSLSLKELAEDYTGFCLFAQPVARPEQRDSFPDTEQGRSWFWGTLWRFKGYYAEAILAALIINVLSIASALFIMNVYDRVVPNNALETLYVLATGTAIAVGFEFLARTFRSYFVDTAGKKADLLLSSRLFSHALGIRMDARPGSAGSLASQLREFESLRDFISSATLATLSDLPFILFFVWVIYLIGGPLYLVPLFAIPVVFIIGLIAQFPLAYVMNRYVRETALKHGLLVESMEGAETLKSLSAEGSMQARWEQYSALTANTAVKSRFISSLVVSVTQLIQQLCTIAVVIWGVHLIGVGQLTVGALIASVILTGRGLAPLGQLATLMTRYQHARSAYFMLKDLMKRPTDRDPERQYLQRDEVNGSLQLKDVTFHYPGQDVAAVKTATVSIQPGERVGILGRIGSGKSSLLKLLAGLYCPHEGSVLLDGVDIKQFDPADLRRHVSFVSQDSRLFFGTLRDNITMGSPLVDDAAILKAARMTGVDLLVNQHPRGFDLIIGEGGTGLSGGQRQAVAMARTLIQPGRVLLLDEPTSAMDHSSEQLINNAIKEAARDRTLILVTHKPTMLNLVDRILVMDDGRVLMDGPRDQVLKQLTRSA